MTRSIKYLDFEITRRQYDGKFMVHDFCWVPDDELDSNPEANADYLWRTGGWRAKGWMLVHVANSLREAKAWATTVAENN